MSTAGAVKATSIGAYQLVRKIGEGGMGEVWEAEHHMIGRRAAIKFLLPAFTTNASTVERFFNEARAVAVVADPGIIQIYDYGREGDQAYIVMELLDGEELSRRMKRLGRLAPLDAVRLAKQIASSLASVHEKGVIHRDLKPDNVFLVGDPAVTGGERTKILDFGIAKLTQHDTQFKTQTGALVGTPAYMSPEQCRATPIDHRSDIYSLGVMMFVMVTGRPPFIGEGSGDVLIAHVRDAPPKPSQFVRDVPREVENIIMRCLEKQPDARFASAAELCTALGKVETFLASGAGFEPTSEIVVTYDPAPAKPVTSRRPWVIGGVALALIGAGIAAVLVTRTSPSSPASTSSSTSRSANTTSDPSPPGSNPTPSNPTPSNPTPSSPTGFSNTTEPTQNAIGSNTTTGDTTSTTTATPSTPTTTTTSSSNTTKPAAKPTPSTKPAAKPTPSTKPAAKPTPSTKPAAKPTPTTKPTSKPAPNVSPPIINRGD